LPSITGVYSFTYRSLKDTVAETARGKRVKNVKKIKKKFKIQPFWSQKS